MIANLIDIRVHNFTGTDGKEVKGLIPTFLVPSKDNKYAPNPISFWVHVDSVIGQVLYLSTFGVITRNDESLTDITGLGLYDIAYKFDKKKTLQILKYCKLKED